MRDEWLCQNGDTDECEIILPLRTKNRERGHEKADEMLNDILSALTFTQREFDKRTGDNAKLFLKNLKRIEKLIWRVLR